MVWILQKKTISQPSSFRSIEDFLASPLWHSHKNTPRLLYLEREQDHTLYSLGSLSTAEKALFQFQKNRGSSKTCLRLSKDQAFLFEPHVPPLLGKSPLRKITSLRVELLRITLKQNRKGAALFYYFYPLLGLWQFAMVEKELLFHNVLPPLPEADVEGALQKSLAHMKQLGVTSPVRLINLGPHVSFPYSALERMPFSWGAPLPVILAASFILGACLLYNVYSIACWEKEVALSHQALRQLKAKIETPTYRKLKQEFYHQREK